MPNQPYCDFRDMYEADQREAGKKLSVLSSTFQTLIGLRKGAIPVIYGIPSYSHVNISFIL